MTSSSINASSQEGLDDEMTEEDYREVEADRKEWERESYD